MARPIGSKSKYPLPAETRERMSQSKMGHSPTHVRPVKIHGVSYETAVAASVHLNITIWAVRYRCNQNTPTWKDWQYE